MTLNREGISSYFKKWINPFSSTLQGLAKPERPKSRYSYLYLFPESVHGLRVKAVSQGQHPPR